MSTPSATTACPADVDFIPRRSRPAAAPASRRLADVVAAVEVVEHLENPRAFCRELARIAKPGGWIVVTTPNQLSLLSLLTLVVKQRFSAFQDASYPAHITALLEADLRRIAAECGLEAVEVRYTGQGRIPGTGAHYPAAVSAAFPRLLSDNVVLIGRGSVVDPRPPLWVRALAATVPRMPLGRYWMVNQLRQRRRRAPFMMRLPDRLGGFLYQCDQRDSVAREVCYTG